MYVHCSTKTTHKCSPLCLSTQIPRWKLQWPKQFKVSYLHHELLAQYNDVGQTNNNRLMIRRESCLLIKTFPPGPIALSVQFPKCPPGLVWHLVSSKQTFRHFMTFFFGKQDFHSWSAPQSQKGRWRQFSLEVPKALRWILDRDKPACLVTTKTKHDQDKKQQNSIFGLSSLSSSSKLPLRKIWRFAGLIDLNEGC